MFSSSSALVSLFALSILWVDFLLFFLLFFTEVDSIVGGEAEADAWEGLDKSRLRIRSMEFLFNWDSMRAVPSDRIGDVAR